MEQRQIKPGYYSDISNEEYHAGPGISKSHLDVAAKSPLHYWAEYIDLNREPTLPTPAMVLGTAIHTAILEPDLLSSRLVAAPKIDRRTTIGKAEYAAFEAGAKGKTVLSAEDFAMVLAVRDAVHRHPIASGLVRGGRSEQTFYAIDEETGELVKCRTDYLHDSGMVVDIKSTEDASPGSFAKSVANFRYHVQDPWYRDVIKGALGEEPIGFTFVAVEKSWPHAIGVYYLEDEDIYNGRKLGRRDLRKIAHFKRLQHWPDFAEIPMSLPLPIWARRQATE